MPGNTTLNYCAIALICTSAIFYLLVKTEDDSEKETKKSDVWPEKDPEVIREKVISEVLEIETAKPTNIYSKLTLTQKRIIGIMLSAVSGVLYGQFYTPVLYIQHNYDPRPSKNNLDYVFSVYTGTLVSAIFYFVVYAAVSKNKPIVYNDVCIPGIVSGK